MGQLANARDLPEHQRDMLVEPPPVHQEVGGLEGLAADRARIHTEVREEAVLSGDAREHRRAVALRSRAPHGFVAGIDEDAGMPVERGTDLLAGADAREDPL